VGQRRCLRKLDVWLGLCVFVGLAGRAAGESVFQVKDINTVTGHSTPKELTSVNGAFLEPSTLFFAADDGVSGVELWKSDGTELGTIRVKDIVSGPTSSNPSKLTRAASAFLGPGRLFFTADNGVSGVELWISDGTGLGTHMVKNINGSATSSGPDNLTAVASGGLGPARLFFTANDGTTGVELWVSDGTSGGTVRVKDIHPTGSSSPASLTAVGSVLFFSADDGVDGRELWTSDGTEPGTVRVRDINAGPNGSGPNFFTEIDGTVYFRATTNALGSELWKTDGTWLGTTLVKDIVTGFGLASNPTQLVAIGSTLFFQADDGANGRELWKSDGSGPGTVMVADINPTGSAFIPNMFPGVVVGTADTLFFRANDGVHGDELWKSDGTAPGTMLVRDIYPGPTDGVVATLTNVNGIVFFGGRDAPGNWELWRTDGRTAATFQVGQILPGPADAAPSELTVAGPFLFLSAGGLDGVELYATDLVFLDGFESGDVGVWSSASIDGGDLAVTPAAALHGSLGLSAFVDDTAGLFVQDESPNNLFRFRTRFYLDPNGFDPGEANGKLRVRIFIAFEEEPNLRLVTLVLRRKAGQYSLMARVRLDDGTRAETPFFAITDAPHVVELDWTRSEGPDDTNGGLGLWIDEIPVSTLTGLDNSASGIDFVRLGAMSVKPGGNGTLFFDAFESRRERYIGVYP